MLLVDVQIPFVEGRDFVALLVEEEGKVVG